MSNPAPEQSPSIHDQSPPWLVTGASGYLGAQVLAVAATEGIAVVRAGRDRQASVRLRLQEGLLAGLPMERWLERQRVAGVLHLAAMSRMGDCHRDPGEAMRRNALATQALAAASARRRVPFWMVSTDLVFDGRDAPYTAEDDPSPLSAYGSTKAAAETYTRELGGGVLRIPLLFGPSADGCHGATDMFRAARAEGRGLKLFRNEWRTPLHVRDAAQLIWAAVLDPGSRRVIHLAGPERLDRYSLWQRFLACQGHKPGWERLAVMAVDSTDPGRPRDVSLTPCLPPPRDLDAMLRDS